MSVALNTKHLSSFISEEEYAAIYPQVEAAHKQLEGGGFVVRRPLPRPGLDVIDPFLLIPLSQDAATQRSSYKFSNCRPSEADWRLWRKFWMATTGNAGLLHIPLGEWIH